MNAFSYKYSSCNPRQSKSVLTYRNSIPLSLYIVRSVSVRRLANCEHRGSYTKIIKIYSIHG